MMGALLSDAGMARDPRLDCTGCRGRGVRYARPGDCHHFGRCPCEPVEIPCPEDCYDGVTGCSNCGDEATRIHQGEPSCDLCAARCEDICPESAPDYAGMMASARAS